MDVIKKVRKTISNMNLRYQASTELYMVEPWEKIFIHVLLIVSFVIFWYFNQSVILHSISMVRDSFTYGLKINRPESVGVGS